MRVLMTADTIGGVWNYALTLSGELAQFGVEVVLATMGKAPSANQRAELAAMPNVQLAESTFKLEWMSDPWPGVWDDVRRAGEWLLDLEARMRPDVIHFNNYVHAALPLNTPRLVVAHSCVYSWWNAVHGGYPGLEWNPYFEKVQAGLLAAQLVVAPSAAMLDQLKHAYELSLKDSLVIPNGISADERQTPYSKDSYVFSAGRLWDAAKNFGVLDNVASYLNWPVYAAGSVRDPQGVDTPLPNLKCLGELSRAQMAERYGGAAIFAHPALYEPFGLSVLEAGAAGCSLILGDIASLRENWDGAALFVNPREEEELFGALDFLIRNERERKRLGFKAKTRALDYSSTRMAAKYLLCYERLIDRSVPVAQNHAEPGKEITQCAS